MRGPEGCRVAGQLLARLRGGAFRLVYTEVANFTVEFREPPEESDTAPEVGALPPGLVPGSLRNCHQEAVVYRLTRSVVGLADSTFGDAIVVPPGGSVPVGSLPGDHLFFRAFKLTNAADATSHSGSSFATATLPDVDEGWFFGVGCGDGPGTLCDDGRGGGHCREI